MQFGTRAEIFLSSFIKKLAGSPKTIRKNMYFFSESLSFLEMFPLTPIMLFWQACPRFSAKVGSIFEDKVQKRWKNCTFFKKILKLFIWRHQMHFWKSCRKISANSWIFLLIFRRCWKEVKLFQTNSSKRYSGHVESNFDNLARIFYENSWIFLLTVRNCWKKSFFSKN